MNSMPNLIGIAITPKILAPMEEIKSAEISIEAGTTLGWDKFIGPAGLAVGVDHFGASAPGKDLAEEFGFTADQVEQKIRNHLADLL